MNLGKINSNIEYYYLPTGHCYYDVRRQQFIFFDGRSYEVKILTKRVSKL
jgi:hypothetical protein